MLLEILVPGSFYFAHESPVGIPQIESQLIYFSFSTLTTVGFGDITPLAALAKSFAMIEAVVGPMFVAVFLARLVGVRTSSR
ncbi:potassium channel family protein [Lamprobacter modestohalophilus]|uniref:potassium channel family protein n=1 Tax=Lamprobacter modestohalophilus TaxID=1064514 RepID=UPI002ADEEEAF|nr:potassium channel family protein [Lamprobacter modestohalophilus]MEA1052547.1 potassium channel family protein [Lamprobacter modestohalophilus]